MAETDNTVAAGLVTNDLDEHISLDESRGQAPPSRPPQTEEEVEKCLLEADELKSEGNDSFRAKRWEEALATYRRALGVLPKRPTPPQVAPSVKGKEKATEIQESDTLAENPTDDASSRREQAPAEPEPTELEIRCRKARSIHNANIAACYVKLGEHNEAVAACTEALRDDPQYVKVLQRRAASNEQLGTWTALSSAQEDYKKLLEILPSGPQTHKTTRLLALLRPRLEAAQKRETDEMFGKLKGLGNSLLGNFGLSTDNFKFVPNGQGGYSMNFTQ